MCMFLCALEILKSILILPVIFYGIKQQIYSFNFLNKIKLLRERKCLLTEKYFAYTNKY